MKTIKNCLMLFFWYLLNKMYKNKLFLRKREMLLTSYSILLYKRDVLLFPKEKY